MNRQHKNLIARIEESGKEFLDYLAQLPAEEINRVPAPDAWAIHAVAAHLRDTEQQVFLKRIRRILAEDTPTVENFDQEAWNRAHYSPAKPLKQIVTDFRKARRQFLNLLQQTPDKNWTRSARHPDYGKISIEWLALRNYNHTLEHLHQMLELREEALLRELNG